MEMRRSEAKERSSVACGGGEVEEVEPLSLMARPSMFQYKGANLAV